MPLWHILISVEVCVCVCFEHHLLFKSSRCSKLIVYTLNPCPLVTHFCKEKDIINQGLGARCAQWYWSVLFLNTFSYQCKEMSVCELISIYTGIYKYFYIWTSVSMFSQMLVHIVTDCNPLLHQSFYFLPSLCVHSPSNREKSGSFYLPYIYFHFTSRIQTEPYQNCSLKVPSKATLSTGIEWLYAILLAFSHRDSTHSKII